MRRNTLMGNLTQMHSIANENIDDMPPQSADMVDEDYDEQDMGDDTPVERSVEDTTDAVISEQNEEDVEQEEESVASESIALLMSKAINQSFALEDLAEQLDSTLEDGGDGISPVQAQLVTTGADLMDESNSQIATENFYMDQRFATESLRDTIVEKAQQLRESASAVIGSIIRTSRNKLRTFMEKVQGSHLRLLTYSKKAGALSEFKGQEISDEKILKRLRAHMPMDGNGNGEIAQFLKSGVLEIIRNITSLISIARRVHQNIDPTRPEKTMQAIANFYKEVEKLKNGRLKNLNVQVSVPESFDIDALLATPVLRSIASVDMVVGSGTQSYRVVSKEEIDTFVDYLTAARSEMSSLRNILDDAGGAWLGAFVENTRIKLINAGGDNIDAKKMTRLALHMHSVIPSLVTRLVTDVSYLSSRASRHVVLLVAASFETAGAAVDPSDTKVDASA